jgi:hypothetical protein
MYPATPIWLKPRKRSPRPLPVLLALLIFFASVAAVATQAQVVADPGFEEGGAGWEEASLEVLPISAFGGGELDHVAVLDGTPAEGHSLRQRISGFTVGEEYRLGFEAARWMPGATPALVSASVYLDGVLLSVVTCIGDLTMHAQQLQFIALAPSIELSIAPGLVGTGALLVDNVTLGPVNMLPVQLNSYDAWSADRTVEVEWVTATENGNAYFEVERSTDLQTWTSVATVPAVGQSQTPLHYHVSDPTPADGDNYYHLKQVGQDGNVDVSHAIAVHFDGKAGEALLWPNPATDQVRVLRGEGSTGTLCVVDAQGRTVPVLQLREGSTTLFEISGLVAGQYLVQEAGTNAPVGRFFKQ